MSGSEESVLPGDDKSGCTESDTVRLCSDRRTVRISRKHDVYQARNEKKLCDACESSAKAVCNALI